MDSNKVEKVIVTGATSMIGSTLVAEALAQGLVVTAVIRENSPHIGKLLDFSPSDALSLVSCNINNYKNLDFEESYDAFFHIAWESTDIADRDNVYTHTNNITYTIDALHAAKRSGCSVFVDAGSQAEYGRVMNKLSGSTPCNPESGYGIAKYSAGKMTQLAATQLGIRYCHTRILSTYGPGMDDRTLIVYLIKTLLARETPRLTKCEQLWDFMYVSDTARALLDISRYGISGKTYPIGSGQVKSLREYVEIIRDLIAPHTELGFGERDYYPHQPMYLCADIDELQADTGFNPVVDFDKGIRLTIEWIKTQAGGCK